MAHFTVAQISSGASSAVISRASEYIGRVTITSMQLGAIEAQVRGTSLYHVSIRQMKSGLFTQHCTCPYGAPCKHTIATARVIARDMTLRTYLEMVQNSELVPNEIPFPSPSFSLLDKLRAQMSQNRSAIPIPKEAQIERQLYYAIETYEHNNYRDSIKTVLAISVGVAQRQRGQGEKWVLGSIRNVRSLISTNPRYLTPVDHKLISILATLGTSIDELSLPEIIKYLRLSPHVYYRSGNGRGDVQLLPLIISEPIEFIINIREGADGWDFVPNIGIAKLCDYDPPIIITDDNHLVPCTNTFSASLAKTIIATPHLAKELVNNADTISTILSVQSELPIVLPLNWQDKVVSGKPVPRLTAQVYGTSYWVAQIDFSYLEQVVKYADKTNLYLGLPDGSLVKRDRALEKSYLDQYKNLGTEVIEGVAHMASIAKSLPIEWEIYLMTDKISKLSRGVVDFQFDNSSGIDWLDIDGSVELDDRKYRLAELILATQKDSEIVELGDRSIMLPQALLAKLKRLAPLSDHTGKVRLSRSQVGIVDSLSDIIDKSMLNQSWQKTLSAIRNYTGIAKLAKISGFTATLRTYQKHGINFLNYLSETGFGGILADDMGLGKTVQTIAILQNYFNIHHSLFCLIIAPTSVVANWTSELMRFAPKLRVGTYTGPGRQLPQPGEIEIILTNYAIMRLDDARLTSLQYDYAILDEAQYAKNVESQTAKVVRRLKAKNRLCLTGTPIENNLTELYSQMQFLNPGIFGTLDQFKHNLAIPIEKHSDKAKSQHLQELIKPFILRRTKEQVLLDLPSKTEQLVTIEMGDAQRQFYESIKNYYQAKILKLVDEQGVSRSHLQILEALLRLRQVCCDPRLIKSNSRAGSVKLTETIRLITEALAEGHKILLFSQFTSMIELIKEELIKSGLAHLILTGSTPSRQRAQLIKDFQDSSTPLVFLLSLKAGGIGVNLTGADYVIHYDPWWNPSVENQATDRAHRIGQTKAVTVYKLIIKNSIEEKILTLQAKKRDLIDRVILGGKVSKELTREDLEYLLG